LHQLPFLSVATTLAGWLYGGLPYACMLLGPLPLRLVSATKWVVATVSPMFCAYHWVVRSQVLKSLWVAG
jgi:hypothetical protein